MSDFSFPSTRFGISLPNVPAVPKTTTTEAVPDRFVRFGSLDENRSMPASGALTDLEIARRITADDLLEEVQRAFKKAKKWRLNLQGNWAKIYREYIFDSGNNSYTVRHFQMRDDAVHYVKTPQYRIRSNVSFEHDITPEQFQALAEQFDPVVTRVLQKNFGLPADLDASSFIAKAGKAILAKDSSAASDTEFHVRDEREITASFPTSFEDPVLAGKQLYLQKWYSNEPEYTLALYNGEKGNPVFSAHLTGKQALAAESLLKACQLSENTRFMRNLLEEVDASLLNVLLKTPQPLSKEECLASFNEKARADQAKIQKELDGFLS